MRMEVRMVTVRDWTCGLKRIHIHTRIHALEEGQGGAGGLQGVLQVTEDMSIPPMMDQMVIPAHTDYTGR